MKSKKIKSSLLHYLPIFCIILLAAILRFIYLDRVPTTITGDELTYVLQAKAIALTGKGMIGNWSPLSVFFFQYPPGQIQAELPYFLLLPVALLMKLSLLNIRLPYALLSIGTVVIVYLIAKKLFGKQVAIIAGVLAAINPWLLVDGRTAYEMVPATFFYVCALYILLIAKRWKIVFVLPFLFLAFYSYIATKLLFLPFVFISAWYAYVSNKKQFLKQYVIVGAASVFLVLFFLLTIKLHPGGSRISEILTPNAPEITRQVDAIRKSSVHNPLTNLFENKLTIFGKIIIIKFFNTISFDYLFLFGDNFWGIWSHGLFYYIDAIFLFVGSAYVCIQNKKKFLLIFSLAVISILPQIFHSANIDNFTAHITLLFPFSILFIAPGIWQSTQMLKTKLFFNISSMVIFFLYFISLLNFVNIYFFQYPIQGQTDFSTRILSKYLSLARENKQNIAVYSTGSPDLFHKYLFYSDRYDKQTVSTISDQEKSGKYTLDNIKYLSCDPNMQISQTPDVIVYDKICAAYLHDVKHIKIVQLSDSGEVYAIYHDNVCTDVQLKPYIANLTLADFAIEKMSRRTFCQTFIIQ